MRDFDGSCLVALVEIAPEEIKRIRMDADVSQMMFARFLNSTESTVQSGSPTKWPSGKALKMLTVVE